MFKTKNKKSRRDKHCRTAPVIEIVLGNDDETKAKIADSYIIKQAHIGARYDRYLQQRYGLQVVAQLLKELDTMDNRQQVVTNTAIATGYVNAMRNAELITDKELQNLIEIIGETGEAAAVRIELAHRPLIIRFIAELGVRRRL